MYVVHDLKLHTEDQKKFVRPRLSSLYTGVCLTCLAGQCLSTLKPFDNLSRNVTDESPDQVEGYYIIHYIYVFCNTFRCGESFRGTWLCLAGRSGGELGVLPGSELIVIFVLSKTPIANTGNNV